MNLTPYKFKANKAKTTFRFDSYGPKGKIAMAIVFQLMDGQNMYNLAFGVFDKITKQIDDTIIINNGDVQKIFQTIATATLVFSSQNPSAIIYAEGNSRSRNRIYRMMINNNFNELSNFYRIWGLINLEWEKFLPQKNYEAFAAHLIKKN